MNQASKTYVSCHKGNVFLFRASDVAVYGGGWTRESDEAAVDVVIDLAGNAGSKWSVPEGWRTRNFLPLVVKLPMNDGEEPLWDKALWPALWGDLRDYQLRVGRPISVLVECSGGHGRTGLVLACLAEAAGVLTSADDPVAFVRKMYCKEAIETQVQIEYIEWATGKNTKEKPKPLWSGTGYDAWVDTLEKEDKDSPEKKASTYLGGAVGYEYDREV